MFCRPGRLTASKSPLSLIATRMPDRTENWDIYLIEAKAGAKEHQLTTTREADCHPDWESPPAWSPDGKTIAYLHGGDPKKIEYATHSLAIIPAAGGEPKYLTAAKDRNASHPRWNLRGQAIYFIEENDGAETLEQVVNVNGTWGPNSSPAPVMGGRRMVTAFSVGKKNDAVVIRASTPDRPYEIFLSTSEGPRCLTKQNDAFLAQIQLGRVEETKFKSKDGTEVHGFIIHPPNEKPGAESPAVLRPHGGPQSQFANEFEFEKQLFAANGYAVIMPNPRGSTGRGTDYAMGIFASWGERDVEDDLAAVDDAVARGIADPERLGVGGWSYGGMSTNYLIASDDALQSGGERCVHLQYPGGLRDRPIHSRLRIRAWLALGAPGSVAESFLSFPARR